MTAVPIFDALRPRAPRGEQRERRAELVMHPEAGPSAPRSSAATASSIDCSSASDADRVCDCGEGVQWPKKRKPM
jgi:hypothetical protein